jgi:hypothetical protein
MILSLLWISLLGFLLFQIQHSRGIDSSSNSIELEKILAKYWSWWSNSPEDQPEKNPKCSIGIDTEDSFVFLLDSFETGDVAYDCAESPIPRGYSIMFPILTAFCSQGDKGLYNRPYEEVRDCALNLDRGKIKGVVSLDDQVIVNISKDNGNGLEMNAILNNNLPQYDYYKEIFSKEFVNLLTTSNTTVPLNWEHPEEFEKSPIYYKAVVHCDCVIIDTNDFNPGNHTLKYTVDSMGGKSSIDAADTGWKFKSNTAYQIVIQ